MNIRNRNANYMSFIDIFTSSFSFSINYKLKLSSFFGMIMSVIVIFIMVVLFFTLGKDFISKQNPITSTSLYQFANYPKINLTEDYSTIVISLTQTQSNSNNDTFINMTGGFLFGELVNIHSYYNDKRDQIDRQLESIEILPCDKSFLEKYNFPNSLYYCLNLSKNGILQGDNREINSYYFNFILSCCEDQVPYGFKGKECRKLEELTKLFKNNYYPVFFHIYTPIIFYEPSNYEKPSSIVYTETKFPFDINLQRTDSLYFSQTILEDDEGWLFTNKKNTTFWTIEEKEYFYQYKNNEEFTSFYSPSKLYSMYIFMTKNVTYNTRSYMKLTSLISYIFCYIRIIISIMSIIFSLIVNPLINQVNLSELFFDNELKKENSTKPFTSIKFNTTNHIPHSTNTFTKNDINNKLDVSNLNKSNEIIKIPSDFVKQKKNKNLFRINTSNKQYILYSIKTIFLKKKVINEKNKHFRVMDKIIAQNYDLLKYTNMIYELMFIKKTLLTPEKIFLLEKSKKLNINNLDETTYLSDINLLTKDEIANTSNDINQIKNISINKASEYCNELISENCQEKMKG